MNTILLALRLTLSRLFHERLAALCLCIAIAAALTPLLMILGLKEGTVAMLRNRLIADPCNLEVRLPDSSTYSMEDVEKIRRLPQVQFCIPGTRTLALSAMLQRADGSARAESLLLPTAAGDPLLTRYHLPSPQENELTLSEAVAQELQVAVGDTVRVEVSRVVNNKKEVTVAERRVCGILPEESDAGRQTYVPLSLQSAAEEYKEFIRNALDGEASGVELRPVYYGFMVDSAEKIAALPAYKARKAMVFAEQRPATEAERGDMPEGTTLYFNPGQFRSLKDIQPAYSLLRSAGIQLRLWNPPLSVSVQGADSAPLTVCCVPDVPVYGGAVPALRLRGSVRELCGRRVLQLSPEVSVAAELEYDESVPAGTLQAEATVLGLLHHALHRGVHWDEGQGVLLLNRRTYSRLRLYARTPEDVAPLAAALQDPNGEFGYRTEANLGAIRRVQILNSQLEILFRLLACIGVAGSVFSLALSLFNGVLKRQREYAILCTLGFSRAALALFPVLESLLLTLLSVAAAFGVFHLLSGTISMLFSSAIESGESLCYLSPSLHLQIVGIGLLVALVSAIAAAVTVMRVQPSAAIRDV